MLCSAPFRNLRFLGIPKKRGLSIEGAALSTENAATESAMDPVLSTSTYYDVTGYCRKDFVVCDNCPKKLCR